MCSDVIVWNVQIHLGQGCWQHCVGLPSLSRFSFYLFYWLASPCAKGGAGDARRTCLHGPSLPSTSLGARTREGVLSAFSHPSPSGSRGWCLFSGACPTGGGCGGVAVGLSAVLLQPQPGAGTGLSVLEVGFSPGPWLSSNNRRPHGVGSGPCPSPPFRVAIDFLSSSNHSVASITCVLGVMGLPPFPHVLMPFTELCPLPSCNHGGRFSLVSHPAPNLPWEPGRGPCSRGAEWSELPCVCNSLSGALCSHTSPRSASVILPAF